MKVSKKSVNYRESEDIRKRCGRCSMYCPPTTTKWSDKPSCTYVTGDINRNYVCDAFKVNPRLAS